MSEGMEIDFLQWRVWIGIWLSVIALVVAGFQVITSQHTEDYHNVFS